MNFPTNNPTHLVLTSPVRHELDIAAIQAVPLRALPELHEALSTMIVVADGFLRGFYGTGRADTAETGFLDALRDHLGDLREAVVRSIEDRRPASAEEAQARARLLLLADIAAGATLPEIEELLDRVAGEREPSLS